MVDLLELAHQILESGLSWASATAIILALIKIKDGNHKRKVNEAMRRDIAEIREKLGCSVTTSDNASTSGARKRNALLLQRLAVQFRAGPARQFIISRRKKTVDKINKLILLPIIAQICVILKDAFGITIGTDQQDLIATIAVLVFGLIGIMMNRHKKVSTDENTITDEEKMYH